MNITVEGAEYEGGVFAEVGAPAGMPEFSIKRVTESVEESGHG
jgi:hypothetical protein